MATAPDIQRPARSRPPGGSAQNAVLLLLAGVLVLAALRRLPATT